MKGPLQSAVALHLTLRRRLRIDDGRSHTRFVQRTKWTLPALAMGLLLLVGIWPELDSAFQHVRFGVPRIDLSEARRLRMVNPRYTGIDRDSRPYVLTAQAATQVPRSDDLITLEAPRADLTTKSGNWVEVSGDTGTYQSQPQLLDLYGNVTLYQDRGNEFHTDSAHINIPNGTADSHDPVSGQGPFGHVTAEGFTLYNRGDVIIFTGKTSLTLLPRPKDVD
ncbi:MAG TPA: LPS export ABC transporter periplasmic protein LptC [Stellaceae bacterium]|nr:LPS export ABC transporter periplasmic protein LptC [Stellaceae bacterium]